MGNFILQGIIIGILFGLPAGAVGAMTVQRTLNYGMKAGMLTGLGSSIADCLYACIGAFGLTLISDFLLRFQGIISLVGGGLIIVMGIQLLHVKNSKIHNSQFSIGYARMFFSSFTIGITNPAAILTFLFAFSWFGISDSMKFADGIELVTGVFIGTYVWWGTLSCSVNFFKKKVKVKLIQSMNRAFGILLVLFGSVVLIDNLIN